MEPEQATTDQPDPRWNAAAVSPAAQVVGAIPEGSPAMGSVPHEANPSDPGPTSEQPEPLDLGDFDPAARQRLFDEITERLAADPEHPGKWDGKPVGQAFADRLLADIYCTLYEFRIVIDKLQSGGGGWLGKIVAGGKGRRAR